jgi:2,3-bisphosphoglycerate-dependent phosphoglycerate mutase
MKNLILFFLFCFLVGLLVSQSLAQASKTIILVRHAEKDAVQSEMSGNPELSVAGKGRAERLVKTIGRFRPGAVYSTDTKRTQATAAPMADHRHLKIHIYDPLKQDELVKEVMASKTKRFLIVGHSNTIPSLANLFIHKELFKSLDDDEYGAIWIIRFRRGQFSTVEILHY